MGSYPPLLSTMQLVNFFMILCLALAVSAKKENHDHHHEENHGHHGNLKIWYLYSEVFAPSCRFKCEDSKSFQLLVEESEDCPNQGSPKDIMANAIKPNQFCGAEHMKVCQYCVGKGESGMRVRTNGFVKFYKQGDSVCEGDFASMNRFMKFGNCM